MILFFEGGVLSLSQPVRARGPCWILRSLFPRSLQDLAMPRRCMLFQGSAINLLDFLDFVFLIITNLRERKRVCLCVCFEGVGNRNRWEWGAGYSKSRGRVAVTHALSGQFLQQVPLCLFW